MKRCCLKLALPLGAMLLATSCTGGLFNKIEMKASPEVYAPLGSVNFNLTEQLPMADIAASLGSSGSVGVYNFVDPAAADNLKYLVHYKLASVDLNLKDTLSGLNFDSDLQTSLAPFSMTVPNISNTTSNSVTIDVNKVMVDTVNAGLATNLSSPSVETGSPSPTTSDLPNIPLSFSAFTSASFSAGSLRLALSTTGASPTLSLSLNSIALKNAAGATLSSTSSATNLVTGGTATLPLAGVSLTQGVYLVLNVSTSNGNMGQIDTVHIAPSFSSDCALSSASGLNIETTAPISAMNIPVSSESNFVSAVVGTGQINISAGDLPTGWTGFSRTVTVNLNQTGGLTVAQTGDTPLAIDLAGQTILAADIGVSGSIKVKAVNGSFTSMPAGGLAINFGVTPDISLYTSVKVKPGDSLALTNTVTEPVPTELNSWVNLIHFTKVGMELTFTNSLPAGNDIQLGATSTAFGISDTTKQTLPAGGATTVAPFINTNYDFYPASHANFDMSLAISFPNYDPTTKILTLTNLVPGASVGYAASVKMVTDWEYASIKSSTPFGGTFPEGSTGLDLSSTLGDFMGGNIKLHSVPVYLYLSGLEGMNGRSGFTFGVSLTSTSSAGSSTLVNDPDAGLVTAPTLPASVSDSYTDAIPAPSVNDGTGVSFDLAPIINSSATNLFLNYSLTPSAMTIYASDLTAGASSIEADLFIVLPFEFDLTDDVSISLDQFLPSTGDLLGRTEVSSDETINTLLKGLESLTLTVNTTNGFGLYGDARLTAALDDGSTFEKELSIKKDATPQETELRLNQSEIFQIINTVPFTPVFTVTIPHDPAATGPELVLKNGGLDLGITVSAVTDMDYVFDLSTNTMTAKE